MSDMAAPLTSDAPRKNNTFVLVCVCLLVFVAMWLLDFLPFFFGILVPYAAILIFISGFIYKVLSWARSPVPFRIPTTCGQAKSLPWIKENNLESPHNLKGVLGRMFLEIFFFRSLFRNTEAKLKDRSRVLYSSSKVLWVAAMAFHWCFLIIFLRHLRFFAEPVPAFTLWLDKLDGMFQIGVPALYITDALILVALGYLLWRRVFDGKVRYISLPTDYLALGLLLGIVVSGVLMRHFFKVDIVEVKKLTVGLFTLSPSAPGEIGFWFYVHMVFLSLFFAYFPFSKLMHMPGIFLSPTRNLANNNRVTRHVNPWNHPVKVHTYEEYEDEFRDKMKAAGLPLDKE
jgi:nitrate reductase gamma subunit